MNGPLFEKRIFISCRILSNETNLRLGQLGPVHLVRVRADAQLGHGQRRDLSAPAASDGQKSAEAATPVAGSFVPMTWE